jgi:hypothetical protein
MGGDRPNDGALDGIEIARRSEMVLLLNVIVMSTTSSYLCSQVLQR